MGTRNLTIIHSDGEYKLAQYGQWDGYPDGQGITALRILRNMDFEVLKKKLDLITPSTNEFLKSAYLALGADEEKLEEGSVSMKISDLFAKLHPELSRDTGVEILNILYNSEKEIWHGNQIEFAADSLFCEWAWLIDLDTMKFEGYMGLNGKLLTESDRFYFLEEKAENNYHPIRKVAEFDLNNLPTDEEFLEAFKALLEEEEE